MAVTSRKKYTSIRLYIYNAGLSLMVLVYAFVNNFVIFNGYHGYSATYFQTRYYRIVQVRVT